MPVFAPVWDFLLNAIIAPLVIGLFATIPFAIIGEAYKWIDIFEKEADKKFGSDLRKYYYFTLIFILWSLGIISWVGYSFLNYRVFWYTFS